MGYNRSNRDNGYTSEDPGNHRLVGQRIHFGIYLNAYLSQILDFAFHNAHAPL